MKKNTTGYWLLKIMVLGVVLSSMAGVQSCDSCNPPTRDTITTTTATDLMVDTSISTTTVVPAQTDTSMNTPYPEDTTIRNIRNTDTPPARRRN